MFLSSADDHMQSAACFLRANDSDPMGFVHFYREVRRCPPARARRVVRRLTRAQEDGTRVVAEVRNLQPGSQHGMQLYEVRRPVQ